VIGLGQRPSVLNACLEPHSSSHHSTTTEPRMTEAVEVEGSRAANDVAGHCLRDPVRLPRPSLTSEPAVKRKPRSGNVLTARRRRRTRQSVDSLFVLRRLRRLGLSPLLRTLRVRDVSSSVLPHRRALQLQLHARWQLHDVLARPPTSSPCSAQNRAASSWCEASSSCEIAA
jgi:hypothetical protein